MSDMGQDTALERPGEPFGGSEGKHSFPPREP